MAKVGATSVFSMPKPMKISGRSSSITNAFVNAIIPVVEPSDIQIVNALDILDMTVDTVACAYCGDTCSEWDHLRPLIMNKRPTGYISEIDNLVPSCGKCNQSKGNKDWEVWIRGTAKRSPATRGIVDLEARIQRLRKYVEMGNPQKIDFEAILGKELWDRHWQNWNKVIASMDDAQVLASELRILLATQAGARSGNF